MIFTHSLLWRDVAEYMSLLLIGSSHAPLDALCAVSLQNFRVFQQPASIIVASCSRVVLSAISKSRYQLGCTNSASLGY